jgi:uncharacterized membrane protein YGL010W
MQSLAGANLQAHVGAYAESHRTPVNKALHYVGIPLAAIGILGLLAKVPLPGFTYSTWYPDSSWLALTVAGVWYIYNDWKTGLVPLAALMSCYAIGTLLHGWILIAMSALAVVFHVIGHYAFEGKPPALLSRPVALLEAPAWLLATWTTPTASGDCTGAPSNLIHS